MFSAQNKRYDLINVDTYYKLLLSNVLLFGIYTVIFLQIFNRGSWLGLLKNKLKVPHKRYFFLSNSTNWIVKSTDFMMIKLGKLLMIKLHVEASEPN